MRAGTVQPYRFTVEEYHRMSEVGVLREDNRLELIAGEIVEMTPIGSRHAACVAGLNALFAAWREHVLVWVQNPIRLSDDTEPLPDLALLHPRPNRYASRLPGVEDVLLVIEVAETSLTYDREVKAPLYATMGIPELWIVDLINRIIEVHTEPSAQGYRLTRRYLDDVHLHPTALPACSIALSDVFGP